MRALLFFLVAFLSTNISLFSQESLPNITPLSPEAASMGRYGNLPINQATGRMSHSIPIHTIQAGGNSWPVSLEYNYGGFILEGKPSLSGLGWALSANGAVTREIRGLADGHTNGYYGFGPVKAIIDQYILDEATSSGSGFHNMTLEVLRDKFYKGEFDSQVDKYSVNVGGINFSFKIDANKQPVYLSEHNYKVEMIWETVTSSYAVNSFIVTDDRGIKYHFTEKEHYVGAIDEDLSEFDLGIDTTTSWNLSKIEYLNDQEITFGYTSNDFISYDLSAVGTSLNADVVEGLPSTGVLTLNSSYDDAMRKSTLERRILTSISFPSGTIYAYTTTINNRKVYNLIEVRDHNGVLVNSYNLTYLGNRDALVKVVKNNQTLFDFEYFGVTATNSPIPDFYTDLTSKPLDQDHWKYYNGAGNSYVMNLPVSIYNANNDPDFNSTKLGALTKISYPTGGYTKVSYEQNTVKQLYTSTSINNNTIAFNRQILVKLNATPTNGEREAKITYTFEQPVVASISHLLDGRIDNEFFKITMLKVDPSTGVGIACPNLHPTTATPGSLDTDYRTAASWYRTALNTTIPEICPYFVSSPTGPDDWSGTPYLYENDNSGGRIVIAAGTYEFKISAGTVFTNPMYGELKVQFYEPEAASGGGPLYVNESVGGIRVSQLTDYSDILASSTRYFDYNDDDGFSTAFLNQIPLKKNTQSWFVSIPSGENYSYTLDQYELNAYTSVNASHGNPLYYTKIKSYALKTLPAVPDPEDPPFQLEINPDNSATLTELGSQPVSSDAYLYPEGYTITEYITPAENNGFDYAGLPKQEDITKARLAGESSYGFTENQPYTLKSSSINNYSMVRGLLDPNRPGEDHDFNPNHPLSFKVLKKQDLIINDPESYDEFPSTQAGKDKVKALYQIFEYKEVNASHRVNKQTTSLEGVQQVTDYTYDTKDRLKESITTDSENNTLKTTNYYVDDIANNDDYELMSAANRVSEVVKKESYVNNVITATQQTLYDDRWASNSLPEYISMAKGIITGTNPLKERIKYHKYDAIGNPLEVSKVNGNSISYIWGYNRQFPVAKIENATRAQIDVITGFVPDFHSGTGGLTSTQDAALRSNLPNALVTTYTYIPLIGVSSITDPRGYTTYYEYDAFNRLKQVKDAEGNILSKNTYNYKIQP